MGSVDQHRIDGHKLEFHPHRVAAWRDSGDDWERAKAVYPIYVEVSPMGACNHRCTFCAVDYIGYKTVQLDAGRLGARLLEMGELGIRSVMFAGEGEPLLHKGINRIVSCAHVAGIDTSFTTNGVLLDKLDLAGVAWVKVSLNAGSRETYAKVHRTKERDWDAVWANIKDAVKRKGACEIGVQMVLLPENEHEAPQFRALCEDAGVDYIVLKPYSQHRFSITREYEGFKPVSFPQSEGKLTVREAAIATTQHDYDKCNATPHFWAYLMASGDLYSCSAYLLDDRFNLGNLNTHTFKEVWQGEKRRANWEYVRKHLDIRECRLNCRMNAVNKYLAGFDSVRNQNFI